MEFEIGSGDVIRGFEKAVMEMKKGQEKEIIVKPGEGYGERSDKLIFELEREKFKKKEPINEGDRITLNLPNKRRLSAKVIEIKEDKVKVDCNHELAGKELKFMLYLREVL